MLLDDYGHLSLKYQRQCPSTLEIFSECASGRLACLRQFVVAWRRDTDGPAELLEHGFGRPLQPRRLRRRPTCTRAPARFHGEEIAPTLRLLVSKGKGKGRGRGHRSIGFGWLDDTFRRAVA